MSHHPSEPRIPYGRQQIDEADVAAVVEVLKSEFLTQGPAGPAFEARVADYTGAACAVAVNSATSALHIACLSLGVGPGDWVWTSPITFVASANCALYCGAKVDFVDIDPKTCNLSVAHLAEKLNRADKAGRLPKVVIPVHLGGQPCEMEEIARLAQRYGIKIVEDGSHAVGARYKGEAVGNCRYSDIAVFSFHPVKIVTTAEGGMALTNDEALAECMALLRSHGVTRNPAQMRAQPHGPWYYEQVALGFNYRMTELQAALGLSQMGRVEEFVERRRVIARRYDEAFADLPLARPVQRSDVLSSWHLYIIRVTECASFSRSDAFTALSEAGLGVNLHYIPVHLQPYYRDLGFQPGDFPNAETYYEEAISIPLHPGMADEDQARVIDAVRGIAAL